MDVPNLGPLWSLSDLLPTPQALATTTVIGFALLLALVWLLVNAYQYYPLTRLALRRVRTRLVRSPGGSPYRSEPEGDGGEPPTIDLLLPAYDEAAVIEQAIRSIHEADYPPDRLRLHILVEPDDEATRRRLWQVLDQYDFRLHRIPRDYPGRPNKPRALDYGFSLTDGDIVGVVDAEDLVSPGLFEEVARTFRSTGCAYALGHLDMANEDDGWLNLLFRAEYGFWYDVILPSFVAYNYPIPLGGTTCFFRRDTLQAVAERRVDRYGWPWSLSDRLWLHERGLPASVPWDPTNVTEDFELGLFLWQEGYEFAYLDSLTREESPVGLPGWLTQRTRWQKGKLWTLRQYLDVPPTDFPAALHLYWQSMLPHLGPLNLAGLVIVFWLATMAGVVPETIIGGLLGVGLGFAILTAALFMAGYLQASDRPSRTRTRRAAIVGLSVPFYWLLQWLADLRALIDLFHGRFTWDPSTHLGRHFDTTQIAATDVLDRPQELPALSAMKSWIGLGGLLVLAAGLRGFDLNRWSLWEDELYTITVRAVAPLPDLLVFPTDPHPPIYFILVRVWMTAAGATPFALRVLSIIFSLATILGLYHLGRTLYDRRTGLLGALLLTISTAHIHFGRTVRMYSLFTFLAVASWAAYVHLRTDTRSIPWLDADRIGPAVVYVLVTLALLYTHLYGVFVVASQYVHRWLSCDGRILDRRWRRLQAVISLGFLPWMAVLVRQAWTLTVGSDGVGIGWIPAPTFGLLRETLLLHAGYPRLYPILVTSEVAWWAATGVSFVFNVALVFSVLTYEPGDGPTFYFIGGREAGMLAVFLLVPILLPFTISLVVPIFVPRYTIAVSLPLFLLVGRGLINVRSPPWRWLLLAVIVLGAAITTGTYFSGNTQEDWRGIATLLDGATNSDDLLVIQPAWIENDLAYYAESLPMARVVLQAGEPPPSAIDALSERSSGHETVWLITYEAGVDPVVRGTLSRHHEQVDTIRAGAITVIRYDRR